MAKKVTKQDELVDTSSEQVEETTDTDTNTGVVNDPKKPTKKPEVPYDLQTKRKVRELIASGRELDGDEPAGLIDTYYQELIDNEAEEATEAVEIEGVPNILPVRTEDMKVQGKDVKFPVFFVAQVKGGFALYNERGQRVSPVCTTNTEPSVAYINKAASRSNALRRANRLPEDFLKA